MRQLKLYGTAAAALLFGLWIILRGSHCATLSGLWRHECKGSKVTCYDESMDVLWRCLIFRETKPPPQ